MIAPRTLATVAAVALLAGSSAYAQDPGTGRRTGTGGDAAGACPCRTQR